MKYTEFKQKPNIGAVMAISGADRHLCFSALEIIKKAAVPNFADLNLVNMAGEDLDFNALFDALAVCPFGDPFRLIIVSNFNFKKLAGKANATVLEKLNNFASVSGTSIVVFFNAGAVAECPVKNAINIDCGHLTEFELGKVIDERVRAAGLSITPKAKQNLIAFTLGDLSTILNECDKLIFFKGAGEICESDLEQITVKQSEFQVFELTDAIAKNQAERAFDIAEFILTRDKNAFSIISPLYSAFRRSLFITINKEKTDAELAKLLGVKEYAVKMQRAQARAFSPKQLKTIVDLIADLDKNIKQGKIKEGVGLTAVLSSILKIRKGNG